MDRRILCDCLIKWVKTLNLNQTINGVEDFSDGILIAICLNNIDSSYFHDYWLKEILTDTKDNYRIKASNLNKVLQHMIDYYLKILDQPLIAFQMPDLNMIVVNMDKIELSRLLQLVLGCSVNCDSKQIYIEHILSMEESMQVILMNAIKELMIKENQVSNAEYSALKTQLRQTSEELDLVVKAKKDIEHRCYEYDLQISTLQDEKFYLSEEIKQLNERLHEVDNIEKEESRYKILQQEIQSQQEDMLKMEAALQDYKKKYRIVCEDNASLLQRNNELMARVDDTRNLRDELDILRNKCDKINQSLICIK